MAFKKLIDLVRYIGTFDLEGRLRLREEAASPSKIVNSVQLYSKDKGGVATLFWLDDKGIEHDLSDLVTNEVRGLLGREGADGEPGDMGPPGPAGSAGIAGATGAAGVAGSQGPIGLPGLDSEEPVFPILIPANPGPNMLVLAVGAVNQSIADSTVTVANYGAEIYDNNGLHDNSTNNSRITVPIAGKWAFWAIDFWDNRTDTGTCGCRYRRNGSIFLTPTIRLHNASDGITTTSSGVFSVIVADLDSPGDYIEHLVIQINAAAGAVNLLSDGTLSGSSQYGAFYLGR